MDEHHRGTPGDKIKARSQDDGEFNAEAGKPRSEGTARIGENSRGKKSRR